MRALTNGSGGITDSYSYDAFGNPLTSSGSTVNPYRYTGQQLDSLTGLYDLRARYYDPTVGRFTSRDTAGIDVSNPMELNRYSYAEANPINLTDPSGHGDDVEETELYGNVLAATRGVGIRIGIGGGIILTEEELIALLLITIAAFLFWLLLHGAFVGATAVSTTTSSSESSSGEVLLDNNEIVNYNAIRVAVYPGLAGQSPVTIKEVLGEVPHGFFVNPEIHEVPTADNPAVFAELKSIEDTIQSNEDHTIDAKLGTTMLDTDRGLITLDTTLCASLVIYDLKHLLPFNILAPDRLRPWTPGCQRKVERYINYHG